MAVAVADEDVAIAREIIEDWEKLMQEPDGEERVRLKPDPGAGDLTPAFPHPAAAATRSVTYSMTAAPIMIVYASRTSTSETPRKP